MLRVLNLGSAEAWCNEMGIAIPAQPQPDLRDLHEAARTVRTAFFAMLENERGAGALNELWRRVQNL